MRNLRNIVIGLALASMVAVDASAQDLIARRAPSDNHMIDVKNVKISHAFFSVKKTVATEIYSDWDNSAVSKVAGFLPASYKVDLRGFCMPTPSRKITSNFGRRWGKNHRGIDVKVYIGDTIVSAFDGKVRISGYDAGGWGKYVLIRHPNGLETLYGHLSRQLVVEDQMVKAGQPIGLGGVTGKTTGSHLHFETRLLGETINPALMFDFANQDVTGDYFISNLGEINKRPAFPIDLDNLQPSSSNKATAGSRR